MAPTGCEAESSIVSVCKTVLYCNQRIKMTDVIQYIQIDVQMLPNTHGHQIAHHNMQRTVYIALLSGAEYMYMRITIPISHIIFRKYDTHELVL